MPEYWNPEGGEFKMKGFPYPGKSPVKKHDGTTSTTTHYTDGSPKSKREVDFSKRHEEELEKEKLLDQGFTPEDTDQMIKTGAVTGKVESHEDKMKRLAKKYKKTPQEINKILKSKEYKEGKITM